MVTACILLLAMGLLGAFDIAYFHAHEAKLASRPESRVEVSLHVVRGIVYFAQFVIVPNVRFTGAWVFALIALFVVDAAVALADVLVEPKSRASQGGLPPGEYFAHVVLSVLAGALLHAVISDAWAGASLPANVAWEPRAPDALRAVLGLFGAGSLLVAIVEGASLIEAMLPKPKPIHVSVRLRAEPRAVWDLTQNHRVHPEWDHRFSRIEMQGDVVATGTRMIYEKTICGFTIRGWGMYKLHKPIAQSTFEFGSDQARSIIRRGVGLWRYTEVGPGETAFATSYTYEVRWGFVGRLLDRLVVRRFFQWETERSFRRLAERYFPEGRGPVRGAVGRKPARLSSVLVEGGAWVE